MNLEERSKNQAAIKRIEEKIDRLRQDGRMRRTDGIILTMIFIMATLSIIVSASFLQDMEKMQEDALNQIMELRQEVDRLQEEGSAEALSAEDRLLAAKVCMAETNNYEGYLAVAQVMHNRSVLWDMPVYDVLTQDSQFAAPHIGKASDDALAAVDAVFNDGVKAFDSNATHFYADGSREPYWTTDKEYVGTRGGNRFYI